MKLEIDTYEDIYNKLKRCFKESFGDSKNPGQISMEEVKYLIKIRQKKDFKNNLPANSLIEIPNDLYKTLKKTYLSRNLSCVSGKIGCAETEIEQLDGITNMALLMYLSNHLSKQYKFKQEKEPNNKNNYKKNEKKLLLWKDIALTNIIASTYILSKTSNEYKNFISYGSRKDKEKKFTFVIDLPYIGQICVHFGWDENRQMIIENAENTVKSILKQKLEMGQISKSKFKKINYDLDKNGVLPEYEGKLYEYVTAMPMEYIGENIKETRQIIGNKLPEDITYKDIEKLRQSGLNKRELYYFLIKIGASKDVLEKCINNKKITSHEVKKATNNVTMQEFNSATQDLKKLAKNKNKSTKKKYDKNGKDDKGR